MWSYSKPPSLLPSLLDAAHERLRYPGHWVREVWPLCYLTSWKAEVESINKYHFVETDPWWLRTLLMTSLILKTVLSKVENYIYQMLLCALVAQSVKDPPAMWETWVWSLGWEDPLEKEMAIHSSIPAWEIPWTEEPGGLQSMGLQRVGHDWVTKHSTVCSALYTFIISRNSSNHPVK